MTFEAHVAGAIASDVAVPPSRDAVSTQRPSARWSEHWFLPTAVLAALVLHGAALLWLLHRVAQPTLTAAGHPAPSTDIQVAFVTESAAPVVLPTVESKSPPYKLLPVRHDDTPRRASVLTTGRPQARTVETSATAPPSPPAPAAPSVAAAAAPASSAAPAFAQPMLKLPTTNTPKFLSKVACHFEQPEYPPRARRLGHEGTTTLHVTVDAQGHVTGADIVASSGYQELDAAAQEVLLAGHCDPHLEGGIPVAVQARQAITFNLEN